MRITIRLFARLREQAGADEVSLDLPDTTTVAEARAALVQQIPALAGELGGTMTAVNEVFRHDGDSPLADGDCVALIPPVSGG